MSESHKQHAFPSGDGQYAGGPTHDYGMELRDWFAGQALAGLLASQQWQTINGRARDAYAFADAMLAQRLET